MANHSNHVGEQLGNYRLMRLLGEGGFAEVYLGEHIHLGTQAAVKVLHARLTNENVDAFRTEARTIARLVHPHVVRVLDFGVQDKTPFLVMHYAANGTLRSLYPKGASLPIRTIVMYIKQVADALQYAHDEKLVHRDVKPENMLVSGRNEVLLSDFGIALVAQSSRQQSTQEAIGTVAYMSPEQIQGKPRPASDQYSLGIVVYEWLCGDRPFHGTFTELCTQHMFAPPPPLREKMPSISPDIEYVVMTALAKDPRQRFANVRAFATALEQASRLEPNQLPPSIDRLPTTTEVTLPVESPLPTIVATPTGQTPAGPTTEVPPSKLPTQEVTPVKRPSRRAVIAGGLAGLLVSAAGITWFAVSRGFIPKPARVATATPLPLGTTLYVYRGHSDQVYTVAWSPDGKRLASGSRDETAQVWNATDGGNVYTYTGHSNSINAVAWSPDGKRIASGSFDDTVQVWNAADGSNAYTYRGHSDVVYAVAWSPDGQRIASASLDKTVQVWNAADGSDVYIYRGHSDKLWTVAWSPDGIRIASGSSDETVKIWDAADGGNPITCTGHTNSVLSVAWSPDSERIVSGSYDRTARIWNAADGGHIYTYTGHTGSIDAVAWSPDGQRIVSSSDDKTARIWNAVDGSHVYIYKGHSDIVEAVAWSPDGSRIASASYDKTVRVWEAV
jgi:eukaryotic-like serine/threonine-protein kinase